MFKQNNVQFIFVVYYLVSKLYFEDDNSPAVKMFLVAAKSNANIDFCSPE